MQQTYVFPRTNQLSILTSVLGLGYVVARYLELPVRTLEAMLFGSSISVVVDGQLTILLVLIALTTTGTDVLIRTHPRLSKNPLDLRPLCHWVVPALTALSVGVLLNSLASGPMWLLGMIAGLTVLVLVLVAEYAVIDRTHRTFSRMQTGLTLLAYLVALVWFSWISHIGARAVISATFTFVIGGAISFRLLYLHSFSAHQASWNSVAVGLIIAELLWVLSYWALPPLMVGAWLLLVLHLAVGFILKGRNKDISVPIMVEYSLVVVIVLVLTTLIVLG